MFVISDPIQEDTGNRLYHQVVSAPSNRLDDIDPTFFPSGLAIGHVREGLFCMLACSVTGDSSFCQLRSGISHSFNTALGLTATDFYASFFSLYRIVPSIAVSDGSGSDSSQRPAGSHTSRSRQCTDRCFGYYAGMYVCVCVCCCVRQRRVGLGQLVTAVGVVTEQEVSKSGRWWKSCTSILATSGRGLLVQHWLQMVGVCLLSES